MWLYSDFNSQFAVECPALWSFKINLFPQDKNIWLHNHWSQELQTDLGKKKEGEILFFRLRLHVWSPKSNPSPFPPGSLGLSCVTMQTKIIWWQLQGDRYILIITLCPLLSSVQEKAQHFIVPFSQSWLYSSDLSQLGRERWCSENERQIDCVMFLQHNLEASFLESKEIDLFCFQFYTDPDSLSCSHNHTW